MLKKSQEGVSFITVMLLAPLIGLFVLVVIKLVPVYVEYESVKSVINGMTSDRAETYASPNEVRSTISKRLSINEVKNVSDDNVTIEREGNVYAFAIDYEVTVPLFYNISILVHFVDKGEVSAT